MVAHSQARTSSAKGIEVTMAEAANDSAGSGEIRVEQRIV